MQKSFSTLEYESRKKKTPGQISCFTDDIEPMLVEKIGIIGSIISEGRIEKAVFISVRIRSVSYKWGNL
jgi:hypothetical protein